MSVCVSVNPVFATNQELNLTVLVSSLSVYANYSLSATFAQPIRSRILSVSYASCNKLLMSVDFGIFAYLVFIIFGNNRDKFRAHPDVSQIL